MNNDYETRFWRILERENLADLSQFHKSGSFDEIPLFSRARDIDFLPSEQDAASEIVMGFALKLLKSVVAYEEHRAGYFAAITVWSLAQEPLLPYLFTWCGDVRELKQKLSLRSPTTSFAKRIMKLVSKADLTGAFGIGEDALTLPRETRVFIAPEPPPYHGFAPLSAFHNREKAPR